MSEPGVVPSRQRAFAACVAFCLKCRWRLEDAAWHFFSRSRKMTCAPKEHSGRQYPGFQLWDGGPAAEIFLFESAWEQGQCQTQCCQAHYLNPEEVKRTNFFHYCLVTYGFRLTWRHLIVSTHLKLWRKRCRNNNCFGFQEILRASLFLANRRVTCSQSDKQKDKALNKGWGRLKDCNKIFRSELQEVGC